SHGREPFADTAARRPYQSHALGVRNYGKDLFCEEIHWLPAMIMIIGRNHALAWVTINRKPNRNMPSFDIVSEVDKQEIDNALNQARKELATRFDFKGTSAEIISEKDKITLTAEDANRLRGLREIVIGKLAKRGVDLRNIEQVEPDISPLGDARQELKIQQG